MNVDCFDIHGGQMQPKRAATFFKFRKAKKGILLCTDVGARGLDIPGVDMIIQYDAPDDSKGYIHRVGRTARRDGASGIAYLLLTPEELEYISYLKAAKVSIEEYEFDPNAVRNVQSTLEHLVKENYYLEQSARAAYWSYMLAYNSHAMKHIFNVHRLDLQSVASSFGFASPPKINLNIGSGASKCRKKTRKVGRSSNGFSHSNPYGRRQQGGDDRRQFVRY